MEAEVVADANGIDPHRTEYSSTRLNSIKLDDLVFRVMARSGYVGRPSQTARPTI
jgi:hypothetical protein